MAGGRRLSVASRVFAVSPPPGADERSQLWRAVDGLVERATVEGIVAHAVEPLAVSRLRQLGRPVPDVLLRHSRAGSLQIATAISLVERIRASCDGPLVLLKGPELGSLYPPNGRPFSDLDLLAPDAEAVQEALLGAGFQPRGAEVPTNHHHLRPVAWPGAALAIEVHPRPNWPAGLRQIPVAEIFAASVPSGTGVDGVSAPSPHHHALILAVHGWQHRPLRVLRDLIDVAVVSAEADAGGLERAAAALGIGRLWGATRRTIDALFYGGPRPVSLRTWARSLEELRARTPRELDLEALVSGFCWMPATQALGHAGRLVRSRIRGPKPLFASRA